MGSCWSCLDKDAIRDNHPTKFKVTNVDDDGNELGSGIMELTNSELILHTRKRDAVRWPYLCLRRYGYDSNLFSFESGRRCQTGQGIFAFKCARAEEIFNLLQEIMQCNSINVVEEPIMISRNTHPTELDLPRTPQTPTTPGFAMPGLSNGFPCYPQMGDGSSHPSTRHPSIGSTRLSSVGEDSTHPLIVGGDDQIHTYVNTSNVDEERKKRPCVHGLTEARSSVSEMMRSHANHCPATEDRAPQVLLQPGEVKFVLGPTPVQKRIMERERIERQKDHVEHGGSGLSFMDRDNVHDGNEHSMACGSNNKMTYENINGLLVSASTGLRRGRLKVGSDGQNLNNCAPRKTAMLNYENLPSLPPVWESQTQRREEEDWSDPGTPPQNGYHSNLDPLRNYVNTENVTIQPGLHKVDFTRRRDCTPNVFSFDFKRPCPEQRQLNYIQVDLEGGSDSDNPQTPKMPSTPVPPTPTRRTEFYAVIDIKKTAAMSSLQKALPRDDGTSRKTRHNSTDLPFSSFVGTHC
ncbi:fibroblast growth factor receptor substrate 2-like isoform X1 [Stegostoma tigrinum]|uniref:fibroblast growth factor receptor substrate 2-like isoform X1 n=2 Tax=Stegostoma tigrinum TaxID=3053191 RepID=UPI00202B7DD3|nr:fibroblast growth factor receptor substrate 2-like isoform X1 [Stegostoma tigrinum]XP_048409061.1 fibroblast growth factor receptor substrate 2-like isoform X1 [Stegostoma tigrinum]XP_048409062.1 fibroblast growth factor receptor substrate 2-like isoform X1 [Stegostoma tigrinum]XP_048409064.1 fibroblast growth factor receptor substrate 2-like isoform X1 [Stegostoma tigrinum]XP_059509343.1 fibroblast growth factor receptor substrate 2-like isoform X1 [Stegostoma tigrinum]